MLLRVAVAACATVALAVLAVPGFSQSAGGVSALGQSREIEVAARSGMVPQSVAPSHPFAVGAQLGYQLAGEGEFTDDLIASGLVRLTPYTNGRTSLFFVGNLSKITADELADPEKIKAKLREIVGSARGLDLRGYLEHAWRKSAQRNPLQPLLWGSAGVRVNQAKADGDDDPVNIAQLRGSVGAELRYYFAASDTVPQMVSVSVEVWGGRLLSDTAQVLLGRSSRNLVTFEPTLVVPFSILPALRSGPFQHFAVLAQSSTGITEDLPSQWRIGLMIAAAK